MPDREYTKSAVRAFFSRGADDTYSRGESIFPPYTYAKSVHFIESGFIKIVAPNRDGRQSLLYILGPGDLMPFPGGFGRNRVDSYFIAMSAVKTKRLSSELLLHVVENNTVISSAIMWQIYDLLTNYSNRVYTLSLQSQIERLASFLLQLNVRFGIKQNKEIILNIPLTHAEIAASISATRESVSRYMGVLIRRGILEQRNHILIIKDLPALLALMQLA